MRLTKERKAYVAVFALGLIALAADRLWFSPAGANAASSAEEPVAEPSPPTPGPATESPAAPSFGSRLEKLATWRMGPLQDAVIAPAEWGGVEAPAFVAAPQSEFAQTHRLSAVFGSAKSGERSGVIIDGKLVLQGKAVDGYTLVDIDDSKDGRAAVFERNGIRVRLEVRDKAAAHKADKPGN